MTNPSHGDASKAAAKRWIAAVIAASSLVWSASAAHAVDATVRDSARLTVTAAVTSTCQVDTGAADGAVALKCGGGTKPRTSVGYETVSPTGAADEKHLVVTVLF